MLVHVATLLHIGATLTIQRSDLPRAHVVEGDDDKFLIRFYREFIVVYGWGIIQFFDKLDCVFLFQIGLLHNLQETSPCKLMSTNLLIVTATL